MAVRPDYTTGTLTLVSGSVNFTTTGSALQTIAGVREGDKLITASGHVLKIATITGDNAGTLAYVCPAAAAGAAQPLRVEFQPDGARYSAKTAQLIELLGDGNLQSLAGLVGVTGGIPFFNSPSTLSLLTSNANGRDILANASAFGASVAKAADASAALTTLGGSTIGKALFAAASASTALSTLGVSDFIKTVLDDTDASTARATLGIGTMGTQAAASVAITGGSVNAVIGGTTPDAGTFTTGQFNTSLSVATFSATGASVGRTMVGGYQDRSSVNSSANSSHHVFYNTNGQVGSINTSAGSTAYNATSDETLKDFIGVYSPEAALAIIRADPTRKFTWKIDGSYAVGWGAQTSYAVSSDLATPGGWFDSMTGQPCEEGDENAMYQPWGLDRGARTPYLWAVVPWLADKLEAADATIAALEARIAALEGD